MDAEKLARYARLDPKILRPIAHRTVAQQEALTLIRARNLIVRLRTAAVNAVRGLAKPCGYRLPASSTLCFAKRCHGGHAASAGRGAWPSPGTDRYHDGKDQALRSHHQTTHGDGVSRNTSAAPGLRRRPTHGADLCPDAWQQGTLPAEVSDVGCYLGLRPRRSQSGEKGPTTGHH